MALTSKNSVQLGIILSLITLGALVYALRDEEKFFILKSDFTNIYFLTALGIIIIFSVLGMTSTSNRVKNATRHALVAFTIAYLARLNMAFAVFFIVGVFVYYMDKGVTD